MNNNNWDDQKPPSKFPHYNTVGSSKESQIIWRRDKVLKLVSLGYTQTEIAQELQISQPLVSRDITAITKAAQEDIRHHIEETLPYERKKALMLFETIKKQAIDMANKPEGKIGDRDRIAALALAKDAGKEIIALQTQGQHIKRALRVAGGLKEKLENLEEEQNQQQQEEGEDLQLYDHE